MDKTGEVAVGVTSCDLCSARAVVITGNGAYCAAHQKRADEKRGSDETLPLKSAAPRLEPKHSHPR